MFQEEQDLMGLNPPQKISESFTDYGWHIETPLNEKEQEKYKVIFYEDETCHYIVEEIKYLM